MKTFAFDRPRSPSTPRVPEDTTARRAATSSATMRAMVYRRYGPPEVVALAEVPKPEPKDGEILIRINATTVTSSDWRARSLTVPPGFGLLGRFAFGVFGPRHPILGTELAGIVESVGRSVTRFKPGDEVFAFTGGKYGCHAEYRTMAEDGLVERKPTALSFPEAAALSFGGATALIFLRNKGGMEPGERVLVVGASGGVGSAAVQIAASLGGDVTGVCGPSSVAMVRSLGANRVIDYTQEDFSAGSAPYDIILDTTGTASFRRCERVMRPGGRLLAVAGSFSQTLGFGKPSKASGKKVVTGVAAPKGDDIRFLAALAGAGAYRPVVDRSYPLARAVEAHAYVDAGHKRGNVVLSVYQDPELASTQGRRQ
ncbi:MAG: NAD(P)-dependent alcohol dehydrogenase [Phycisphaeraceae bacterium]|nr:NAD(P)-dependent alcohol dehydrogenase [Phycisphaeraceae bacterium]